MRLMLRGRHSKTRTAHARAAALPQPFAHIRGYDGTAPWLALAAALGGTLLAALTLLPA